MLDIEEFEKKINKKARLLGVDPGKKRVGIAICDENKIVATAYTTIIKNNFSDFLNQINKIITPIQMKILNIIFILMKQPFHRLKSRMFLEQ